MQKEISKVAVSLERDAFVALTASTLRSQLRICSASAPSSSAPIVTRAPGRARLSRTK